MNYADLQSTILATAVRPELTTEVVAFIRMCESMIRNIVDALELRTTLTEADRFDEGIYNLSGQVQRVRAVFAENASGGAVTLENVGVAGIRMLPADADPTHYALVGQRIEFRGVPATDAELELVYFGWPDPLATTDENELLTNYEDLYVYGSLFHLYNYTQDLELAQSALSVFTNTARTINTATARRNSGGSVMPAYNFGHVKIGRGY